MTQRQAADKIYATESAWKAWEGGARPMHAGLWELFKLKTFDREVLRALGLVSASASAPAASESSARSGSATASREPSDGGLTQ